MAPLQMEPCLSANILSAHKSQKSAFFIFHQNFGFDTENVLMTLKFLSRFLILSAFTSDRLMNSLLYATAYFADNLPKILGIYELKTFFTVF